MKTTPNDERFIRRCFELALKGLGKTGTNPIVGAVLVYEDRIIGEGYHQKQGGHHAEVNAIASVSISDYHFIEKAKLYISLEPCNHFGRTGPCTHLIVKNKIPRVIISAEDPNPNVHGNGVQYLRNHGIHVQTGVLKKEGDQLIRPFKISSQFKRPYVLLKSALSSDGFIGQEDKRVILSGPETNKLVHTWRSQADAIMIGTKTAIVDNPLLTVREIDGQNPVRIIIDWNEKIPKTHHLFNDAEKTWIFTDNSKYLHFEKDRKEVIRLSYADHSLKHILKILYEKEIGILIVEGGAKLIQSFILNNLWDEARLIKTEKLLHQGIEFPAIKGIAKRNEASGNDHIEYLVNDSIAV
jgi:diaminohydroxyphosphoribosylaminopyrimidine deaminase/5-amino-6-(5-phosphoribosylamino)uracil reductase